MTIMYLSLAYVLYHWRPGSEDRSWEEEFADLESPERIGEMVRKRDAFGFTSRDGLLLHLLRHNPNYIEPVILGWDGRVWGGHKRLWLHHVLDWREVLVDVVPPGEKRPGELVDCAPPEGVEDGSGRVQEADEATGSARRA